MDPIRLNFSQSLSIETPRRHICLGDDSVSGNARTVEIRTLPGADQIRSRRHMNFDLPIGYGDAAAIRPHPDAETGANILDAHRANSYFQFIGILARDIKISVTPEQFNSGRLAVGDSDGTVGIQIDADIRCRLDGQTLSGPGLMQPGRHRFGDVPAHETQTQSQSSNGAMQQDAPPDEGADGGSYWWFWRMHQSIKRTDGTVRQLPSIVHAIESLVKQILGSDMLQKEETTYYGCDGSVTNPMRTNPAFAAIDITRATCS